MASLVLFKEVRQTSPPPQARMRPTSSPSNLPRILPPEVASTQPTQSAGPVLLSAKGLLKAFGGQVVLDGVDLELRQGEVVLLRGENGSGKTTLLNVLTGNLEPDAGTIEFRADDSPRTFSFPRRWWQELNPLDHFTPEFVAREGIGRTWQDIRLFGAQSLRDNIAVADPAQPGENPLVALVAPGRTATRDREIKDLADSALDRLGLAGRELSSADKISLGQSKRVGIARAVAGGARILFLDEPLAGLDGKAIVSVLQLLETLVRREGLTLVIVEHVLNQPHLEGLVTTDWLLEGGQIQGSKVGPREIALGSPSGASRIDIDTARCRPLWSQLLITNQTVAVDQRLPRGALLTRIRRPERFREPARPALEILSLIHI